MRISFGTIVLAEGLESCESPYDLKIQGQYQVQISEMIRSPEVRAFHRGNLRTQLSFKVKKRHDSVEGAHIYALMHATLLAPEKGPLSLVSEPDGQVYTLSDAAILRLESTSSHHLSLHSYEIIGGKFTPFMHTLSVPPSTLLKVS